MGFITRWICVFISLALLLFGEASATTNLIEQRMVSTAAEGLQACQAMFGVKNTCSTNKELASTGCSGCGKPGQTSGTQYCQATENLYMSVVLGGQCTSLMQSTIVAFIYPTTACPAGTVFVGPNANDCINPTAQQIALDSEKANGTTAKAAQCTVGNPCNAGTGNKYQTDVDFAGGPGIPSFVRTYNLFTQNDLADIGIGWRHNHSMRLELKAGRTIRANRADGQVVTYSKVGLNWASDADVTMVLTQDATGYLLTLPDGTIERYDLTGLLTAVTDTHGLVTTYAYTGNQLNSITGPFGHKLTISWFNSEIRKLTTPDGQNIMYTVPASGNLTVVTNSDATTRQYLYEDTLYPHALTGIIDESGNRIATYSYDAATGRTAVTEHTGGSNHFALSYSGLNTTFTDAAGNPKVAAFSRIQGINRLVSVTSPIDGKGLQQGFDASGNLISRTDEEGSTTTWGYDGRNRVTSTTVAAGTPLAQTTTTTYLDAVSDAPLVVTEQSVKSGQSKTTTFAYADSRFPLLPTTVTVAGFRPDGTAINQVTTLTYNAAGQILTKNGTRTDVIDTETWTYWSCATGAKCGMPATKTNAVGHVWTYDSYDGAGHLTQETEPNGLVTVYGYDTRGRLKTVTETPPVGTQAARVTSYTYDANSRVATSTDPDGVVLTYGYDINGNLTSVQDAASNRVEYGFDLRLNPTSETYKDATGAIVKQVNKAFDFRNHLASITAAGSSTGFTNDALGNVTTLTDGNGHATNNQYDDLHRFADSTDPLSGVTASTYDVAGNLKTLISPNGATWTFTHDDFGNQLVEASPDRGTVTKTYDSAGNVVTSTDARGITATYAWDALNRPTSISYSNSAENVSFTWDACTRGKGRLCTVNDPSGSRNYSYDGFGRISGNTWTVGGVPFVTSYAYTPANRLASIGYPTGRTVAYNRNSLGQVTAVNSGGAIVSSRTYRADGLLASQTFGSGLVDTRIYDTQGKLTNWTLAGVDARTYGFDGDGNITSINAANYGYDWLNRLQSEPVQTFTYDGNGNRTSDGAGSYSYDNNSNQLSVSPQGVISQDAAGNTTQLGSSSFTYNQAGKLTSANTGSGSGQYVYDYQARRTAKVVGGASTLFHYALDGTLLAETTTSGALVREYVNDDTGLPLAQSGSGALTYLYTDHLGTPRIGTNSAKAVVWKWDGNAFGESTPSIQNVVVNRRFSGQYFDGETGLMQNWHRTYEPKSGRYLESDPISLTGGINTYVYINGNPFAATDRLGLWEFSDIFPEGAPIIDIGRAYGGLAAYIQGAITGNEALKSAAIDGLRCSRNENMDALGLMLSMGRGGRQTRLKELANDPLLGASDRGWLQQEINSINRGQRKSIRNPPGKELAHERGREASKGYDYNQSNLQDRNLHKLQHKYDDFGRANSERPLKGVVVSMPTETNKCGCQ